MFPYYAYVSPELALLQLNWLPIYSQAKTEMTPLPSTFTPCIFPTSNMMKGNTNYKLY